MIEFFLLLNFALLIIIMCLVISILRETDDVLTFVIQSYDYLKKGKKRAR